MPYFTPEEITPSQRTLSIIRQVAYSYRAANSQTMAMTCLPN